MTTTKPALIESISSPATWYDQNGRLQLRFVFQPHFSSRPKRSWSIRDPGVIPLADMPLERIITATVKNAGLEWVMPSVSVSGRGTGLQDRRLRDTYIALECYVRRQLNSRRGVTETGIDTFVGERWGVALRAVKTAWAKYRIRAEDFASQYLELSSDEANPQSPGQPPTLPFTHGEPIRMYSRTSVLHALIDLCAQVNESLAVKKKPVQRTKRKKRTRY